MDSDFWTSRLAAAKRQFNLQHHHHHSSQLDRLNIDDLEVEDEVRPEFPCPYCYEDYDIVSLCSHLEDEHSCESKVAVCPICSIKVVSDMLSHITLQHGHLFKMQRRRRLRRVVIPNNCCSLNELPAEPSEIMGSSGTPNEQQLPGACNAAFNSLPTIHINEQIAPQEVRSMQNQLLFSSDSGGRMLLKSYPKTIACEESMGLYASKDFLMSQQTCHQRKYFAPHWSVESVNEALEKGNVFKALFRVNAHNRLEAYCKINGVQTDVLISGIVAQNRAVVHVVKSDSRLANNDLPVDIQRLRCRALYYALHFSPFY